MPNICTCSGSRVFVRVFVPKIEPQPSVVGSWDLCNVCFARVQRRSVHPAVKKGFHLNIPINIHCSNIMFDRQYPRFNMV